MDGEPPKPCPPTQSQRQAGTQDRTATIPAFAAEAEAGTTWATQSPHSRLACVSVIAPFTELPASEEPVFTTCLHVLGPVLSILVMISSDPHNKPGRAVPLLFLVFG